MEQRIQHLPPGIRTVGEVLMTTYVGWRDDRTIRLGAGLAYYGLFSLASVFTLSLWIVQVLTSRADVESYLAEAMEESLGDAAPEAANAISAAIEGAVAGQLGIVGLVSLLITGSLFFLALEDALNQIWHVPVRHGFRWTVRRRLTSLMVLFAAAATIIASAMVQAVTRLAERLLPGIEASDRLVALLASGLGWVVLATALILLFRFLPAVDVDGRSAVIAGVATAALVVVGTSVIGWYLRTFGATSVTGAASSIIAILLWIFYEAQIVLAGAQLSKALTRRRESDQAE